MAGWQQPHRTALCGGGVSISDAADTCARAEQSLLTTFADTLWQPFCDAIVRYRLVQPGDRIAVCISGGKDSMLLAKLMQLYQRKVDSSVRLVYLIMDPGYNPANRAQVEYNARLLELPYTLFESDIFEVANAQIQNPCFLCARMRRGTLYGKARELGCEKIALGHHFNDVVETTVMAMLYGAQLQAMPPSLMSKNFPGMSLIRPLYLVREEQIIAWAADNGLRFIQCACRFTEASAQHEEASKRREIKLLLRRLREQVPEVEENVFRSIHSLALDTMPAWKQGGERHTYLEYIGEE